MYAQIHLYSSTHWYLEQVAFKMTSGFYFNITYPTHSKELRKEFNIHARGETRDRDLTNEQGMLLDNVKRACWNVPSASSIFHKYIRYIPLHRWQKKATVNENTWWDHRKTLSNSGKRTKLHNLQLKRLFPDIPAGKTKADVGQFLLHTQYYYAILQYYFIILHIMNANANTMLC